MPTLQELKLEYCDEVNRLRMEWYASPGELTKSKVIEHRQTCPICRENMRKVTQYASQAKMPELAL